MSWNYRLVRCSGKSGESYLSIKEVYYNENGQIEAFGDAPVPYGDSRTDVKKCLDLMYEALEKEIIENA